MFWAKVPKACRALSNRPYSTTFQKTRDIWGQRRGTVAEGASKRGVGCGAVWAREEAGELGGEGHEVRAPGRKGSNSRTRSIAFVGLTIALMGASAWVTIPFGPVLFTLQIFMLAFAVLALSPKECLAAISGYLLLGAVGLPMFSGGRGGIGMLLGPTGGFLWGYLLGALAAIVMLRVLRRHWQSLAVDVGGGLVFLAVAYACGWLQYMVVAQVGPAAAFAAAIAPFVVLDVPKVVAAASVAKRVRAAVS